MTKHLDRTHDPAIQSWVASAQQPNIDFPVQNLPFGVFRRPGQAIPAIGIAIGSEILDLRLALAAGLLDALEPRIREALGDRQLNSLMRLGRPASNAVRQRVFTLLTDQGFRSEVEPCLVAASEVEMLLPAHIGDYTDFYASIHHAMNVGAMLRPENPLLPNYKYVPIGYHGRSSTILVSGTAIRRPMGQIKEDPSPSPLFSATRALDYECEVAAFIAGENATGVEVTISVAEQRLFGLCLLNDWSARDVQRWEYQPLGPFLSKNFATSISPWIVTLEALMPFRCPSFDRPADDPDPLPYLYSEADRRNGGFDISVAVYLSSAEMRAAGIPPTRLSRASTAGLYWTMAQMVTHHGSGGCSLRPGDLIGSGTVSGPAKENRGCLLELAWRGADPLVLPSGETRRYLADGDEVILRGQCEREGAVPIGFGECRGTVLPA